MNKYQDAYEDISRYSLVDINQINPETLFTIMEVLREKLVDSMGDKS